MRGRSVCVGALWGAFWLCAWPGVPAPVWGENELETEPLPVVEATATPAPRPKRLAAPPHVSEAAPGARWHRAYGGRHVPRTQGAGQGGRELQTEPIAPDEEAPAATPTPARRAAVKDAKQYSYLPGAAASSAASAGLTEPELANRPQLGGRELKTEPLSAAVAGPTPGEFKLWADLDRTTVHLDESFTLTLEMTAADLPPAEAVHFNRPNGFDLINSSQAESSGVVGGQIMKTRTLHYVFLPLQTGAFTLPPAEISYHGRLYHSRPLDLAVEGPRSGFAYQRQFSGAKPGQPKILPSAPDLAANARENSTCVADLDRTSVYVNQQVTLMVRLRYQAELGLQVTYTPPPVIGFLGQDLQQTQTDALVSGGHDRWLERVYRTALFPIQAGSLTVGAADVAFTKWGQTRNLATEPIAVEVKPLPPDPEGQAGDAANGLVGRYHLTATLQPGPAEVETPLRLQVVLAGEGNLRAAPAPQLQLDPSLRAEPEGESGELGSDNGVVQGTRTFGYLLVPRRPGRIALGRVGIRYFDPLARAWQTAQAGLPELTVAPRAVQEAAAGTPAVPGRPQPVLRTIHGGQETLRRLAPAVNEDPRFWVLPGLGLLGLLLAQLVRRWQRRQLADPQAWRARRAYPAARRMLRAAQEHIRRGEVTDFYNALSRAATEYLAAKFNVSSSTIVSERLNEYFDHWRVPNLFRSRFKITLTACEYVRFAAVELPSHDMRSLLHDLATAIADFERHWRRTQAGHKHHTHVAIVLLIGLLAGMAARAQAGEAELYFLRGNTAYEQGQYETALAEYQRVIALGITDPDVYYNLGNTYVKLNQLGRAILAYEHGLVLAPRDPDLRYNLAQTAAWLVDAQPEEAQTRLGEVLFNAYGAFTANELAWAAAVLLMLALWAWAAGLLWAGSAGRWRRAAWIMAGLCLLCGGWSAVRYSEPVWRPRAVILTPTVDILGRPYHDAEKLDTLHEGTRVLLEREDEEWLEVRFGANRRGWVRRGALGMIE